MVGIRCLYFAASQLGDLSLNSNCIVRADNVSENYERVAARNFDRGQGGEICCQFEVRPASGVSHDYLNSGLTGFYAAARVRLKHAEGCMSLAIPR